MKIIVLTTVLVVFSRWINVEATKGKKMIVFAIGGYRYDYASDPSLKAVKRFINEGVVSPYVIPVYPSLAYTNLYSIVTGLYAENHGIVGDIMYDQHSNKFYEPSNERNASISGNWYKAEPIWTTAEKQGIETALYWWPGCEILFEGIHPIICEIHRNGLNYTNHKIDLLERIDDVIALFENNELNLAMFYYDFVGKIGMEFGPDSSKREKALRTIDDVLVHLMKAVDYAHLQNEVNIVVVSDSGISDVNQKKTNYININRFKDNIQFQVMFGAMSMLLPIPGQEEKLFTDLKHANIKGLDVFKKAEIPAEYHISGSNRLLPLLLQARDGYFINPLNKENSHKQDARVKGVDYTKNKGINGYNSVTDKNMRTVFFAKGPGFKKGFVTSPLNNLDIYNVICHVLRINGLPNNGSKLTEIKEMFLDTDDIKVGGNTAASLNICYALVLLSIGFLIL